MGSVSRGWPAGRQVLPVTAHTPRHFCKENLTSGGTLVIEAVKNTMVVDYKCIWVFQARGRKTPRALAALLRNTTVVKAGLRTRDHPTVSCVVEEHHVLVNDHGEEHRRRRFT
jgi:hypothetical protein